MNQIFNIFITNATTEYLTFNNFKNIYTEENYSYLCIDYLENNPTHDIIIFKNNEIVDLYSDTTSVSSNPSDILSESSIKNIEKNIEEELDTDLENDIEPEEDLGTELESIVEPKKELLKNLLEPELEQNINNETLLTYSQVNDYNFDDKNINIL